MTYEEFSQALAEMDPVELAMGAGMAGAVAVVILVCNLIWFFVSAIGYYKMFTKAGVAGWKAFVPFYRSYIWFERSWNTKIFWPYLVTLLVMQFVRGESAVVGIILFVVLIVAVVIAMKLYIRVAKSFGKGSGWGVLLFFLPFIASLILGFGKAQYIGNTTVAAEEA